MTPKQHWEQVYSTRLAEKLGWYRPHLETSFAWIEELELDRSAPIIDVGGGASTLVDDLVDADYESLTVLDISEQALEVARKRLGRQSELVMWLAVDATEYALPGERFDVWHDRAALHFLVDEADRNRYRENLCNALRPGGYAIIGVFSPEAPPKCSGLPVQRYDHDALAAFLGDAFTLDRHTTEMHVTPGGVEQLYQYTRFRKT